MPDHATRSCRSGLWLVRIATLVVLAATGGCSVSFTYNNLDRLARWQVRDFVDFDDRQAEYFDAEFARLLHWHRTTQLPRYAHRLDSLADAVGRERADLELDSLIPEVEAWAQAIEQQAMPMTVTLMASLSDAQLAGLPARLAKSNEKLTEDEADRSLEAARAHFAEGMRDGLRGFLGRLNARQRDYLNAQSLRYEPETILWADYRRRWQADLLLALAGRGDADAFAARYRHLVETRESYYGERLSAVNAANIRLRRELLLGVVERATDDQRARFVRKLRELADELRELVAEAGPEPPMAACLVACTGRLKTSGG
ncbi:MAG: hypothetical protein H6993_18875 [Pseudomonadales bacterium]|nr:hypothetical protein [Pseudomonadales bacterium]MCP5186038.1 hypothetical protein [Pseudomonadales bacterium]